MSSADPVAVVMVLSTTPRTSQDLARQLHLDPADLDDVLGQNQAAGALEQAPDGTWRLVCTVPEAISRIITHATRERP